MSDFFNINLNIGDLGIVQAEISGIISALVFVWDTLVNAVNTLYDADLVLAGFASGILQAADKWFHHIWDAIWGGIISKLVVDYKKLHDWLAKILGPLIRLIQKIRAWYYAHIFKIIHDIQQVISVMRVILEVFRLLGAKWAAKLDADLGVVSTALTTFNQDVIGTLNKVSTIIGLTVDPAMVFRGDAIARTLWGNLGTFKQLAGYGSARPITASEHATEDSLKNAVTGSGSLINLQPDGTVILDPVLIDINSGLDATAQTAGISP